MGRLHSSLFYKDYSTMNGFVFCYGKFTGTFRWLHDELTIAECPPISLVSMQTFLDDYGNVLLTGWSLLICCSDVRMFHGWPYLLFRKLQSYPDCFARVIFTISWPPISARGWTIYYLVALFPCLLCTKTRSWQSYRNCYTNCIHIEVWVVRSFASIVMRTKVSQQ